MQDVADGCPCVAAWQVMSSCSAVLVLAEPAAAGAKGASGGGQAARDSNDGLSSSYEPGLVSVMGEGRPAGQPATSTRTRNITITYNDNK